jgi:hypothetical protein
VKEQDTEEVKESLGKGAAAPQIADPIKAKATDSKEALPKEN